MTAYYNEIDPFAAAWLRSLISKGLIAPGDVDERSIEDVTPNELKKYTQCHFFAGIGIWSYALRKAGWPDDKPVWTGSCPCQPFSSAGKGKGVADERHLWPAFHWLISQRRPDLVLGEQVAQKAGAAWFDVVSTDLEGEDYTCGKVVFPACGVGAPHLRQRQYWVAHTDDAGSQGWSEPGRERAAERAVGQNGMAGRLADAKVSGERALNREPESSFQQQESAGRYGVSCDGRPRPTNAFWRDPDWLGCRDGKWRPVESGTFPLAHGSPARVGRLRGYGNGIVAPQAQAFIETIQETLADIGK